MGMQATTAAAGREGPYLHCWLWARTSLKSSDESEYAGGTMAKAIAPAAMAAVVLCLVCLHQEVVKKSSNLLRTSRDALATVGGFVTASE